MAHIEVHLPHTGGTVRGEREHVAMAQAIDARLAAEEQEWVARLRLEGIKAAHPDDGWVNREKNEVMLCYPQFNDGLNVGDLLALGWPDRWRIVRVQEVVTRRGMLTIGEPPTYYHFKEVSHGHGR